MYKLLLTHSDRQDIDWIGYRYFHGNDLYELLMDCIDDQDEPDAYGDSWDDPITWNLVIPEHIAWEIKDGLESEDSFCSCFSDELVAKLRKFCDDVV